jgi:anti-sigma regulatory factor (Ser/Thr protein kinase)
MSGRPLTSVWRAAAAQKPHLPIPSSDRTLIGSDTVASPEYARDIVLSEQGSLEVGMARHSKRPPAGHRPAARRAGLGPDAALALATVPHTPREWTEEFRIGPDPRAVLDMRHAVRRVCSDAGLPADACDTAVLLTSETLTNAIVHAGTSVLLVIRVSPRGVRVEVTDDDSRPPIAARPATDATNGRGLQLLDTLATRWGVEHHRHGKTVWFEIVS